MNAASALAIVQARLAFFKEYAREKGWPEAVADLTFQQILEIREQPGWKNPVLAEESEPDPRARFGPPKGTTE